MLPTTRLFAAAALAAALFTPALRAQCFGPDNLNGPCCGPVAIKLPQLPGVAMPGLGICWDACQPTMKHDIRVQWMAPTMNLCSEFSTPIGVIDSLTGNTLITGKLILDYTRTWQEVDPAGVAYQVWRFAAKADLSAVQPFSTSPICPVPSCLVPWGIHSTAFFYGYADYAQKCGSPTFNNSLVLYHGCDFMIHKPGISNKPGVFHPARSYGIVAPVSAVQPFVPMNMTYTGGVGAAEGFRPLTVPGTTACAAEDKVSSFSLQNFANGCLCSFSMVPPQHTLSVFNGKGSCVDATGQTSAWASQMISFPNLPWPHLVTTSIGIWTNPAVYPGPEAAFVDEGLFQVHDACKAANFFDVYYGGSTFEGWKPVQNNINPTITHRMKDLADNYTAGPPVLPIMGSIMPTDRLIYVNLP